MEPIPFDKANTLFAANQPQYRPLPAHLSSYDGRVTSCWELTLRERIKLLLTGKLWLQQLTFGEKLQPQKLSVDEPLLTEIS